MNQSPTSAPVATSPVCQPPPELSFVIPVYNEAGRIETCLDRLGEWMSRRDERIEVLIVDDGSSDDTLAIATQAAIGNSAITVVSEPHLGKANAVLAGLSTARGTYAGFCDVDLATPLATWDDCAAAFANGADIAIASREGTGAIRVGEPWYRHAMGRAFNGLIRLLLLPGIHDTQCGFKFFRQEALEIILPRCQLYRDAMVVQRPRVTAFDVELLYIARRNGLTIDVIPITWTYGEHTKVNPLTDTLQNLRDVLNVRWNGWRGRYD
ncbi:MAG: glycosyltransferase [Chloroflexota bacterium]|nr:glycosyltransferase [Chloroflexota bacterium]